MSQPYLYLPAAHKHHGIDHSPAFIGQVTGAAVGVAIGALLIWAGGLGALVIVPLASSGAELGKQLAKKLLPKMTSGSIKEGAATVVYGADRKPAARILDPIDCMDPLGMTALISPSIPSELKAVAVLASMHLNKFVDMGAHGVTIENNEASRIDDLTTCSGNISSAIDSIWIGGFAIYIDAPTSLSENNHYFDTLMTVAETIDMIKGGPVKWVLSGGKMATEFIFGKDHWVPRTIGIVALFFGNKGSTRDELIGTIAKKIAGGSKIVAKETDLYTREEKVDPELTPEMQRRREVLMKRRPPRQWSDTIEDTARFIGSRGH